MHTPQTPNSQLSPPQARTRSCSGLLGLSWSSHQPVHFLLSQTLTRFPFSPLPPVTPLSHTSTNLPTSIGSSCESSSTADLLVSSTFTCPSPSHLPHLVIVRSSGSQKSQFLSIQGFARRSSPSLDIAEFNHIALHADRLEGIENKAPRLHEEEQDNMLRPTTRFLALC